jgi:hypothetical protein
MWKSSISTSVAWDPDVGWTPSLHAPASEPPAFVDSAPRLCDDIQYLQRLFSTPEPPLHYLRPMHVQLAIYGFVDASGSGLGSSFQLPANTLLYRQGVWGRDADNVSSNYRELRNLVEAIEDGVQSGDLAEAELFVFTDNSTAEGAYSKGNSDSRLLFDLVLRLRTLDMSGSLRLHVIHVAGTRMISQGTDGLSRGDLTEGVLAGIPMLSFIPLHLSPLQRSPLLLDWIREWCPMRNINPLTPEQWYEKGHGLMGGTPGSAGLWFPGEIPDHWFLWDLAPATAPTALDEVLLSRLKRTHLSHVVIVPRLMTQYWRRKLHKLLDVVLEVPAGARPFWPLAMHEPLLIGLTFRFLSVAPWELRHTSSFLELERAMRCVWRTPGEDERPLLRQLCQLAGVLDPL